MTNFRIASLASGPLSSTSAYCAKVATSPENAPPGYQHVICVYIPDVYDKEDVTAVCLDVNLVFCGVQLPLGHESLAKTTWAQS